MNSARAHPTGNTFEPVFRPDLTEYSQLAQELADKLNDEAWSQLSKTDVVKIALERFYKDAFPDRPLRRMKRKYFIRCNY